MKPLKKSVSVTLDTPILERTKAAAEYPDRSLSSYMNLVPREQLDRPEEKREGNSLHSPLTAATFYTKMPLQR